MDVDVRCLNHRIPPDLIDDYLWLQKIHRESQQEYRRNTPPNRRLEKLIRGQCVPAKSSSWRFLENVWVWKEAVVFELEKASWDDVPGSEQWLTYLRRIYVVDSKRGAGYGSQFLRHLCQWAGDSGVAVCLVSLLFGFSRHAYDKGPFFLETLEDVLGIWDKGEIQPVLGGEWLRGWYARRGFRQVKLLDDHFFRFRSKISELDQFVFVPDSLDESAKRASSHRLCLESLDESTEGG